MNTQTTDRAALFAEELLTNRSRTRLDRSKMTARQAMARWPRLTAHMICHSLGYATPELAALIVLDAANGRQNWCEWIMSCYRCDPKPALASAIRGRHGHRGFMASYPQALELVQHSIRTGNEPLFASWM